MAITPIRTFKPKEGDSVFQFIEGVTYETFESDEEMRCGTIRTVYSFQPIRVEIEWTATSRREILKVDETWVKLDKGTIVIETAWDGFNSGHLPRYMQTQYKWHCCARCDAHNAK